MPPCAPLLVAPTHDRLLVICYGGLMDGLGMGLVFRGRGTTGGTDVLARLARRYLGVGIGQALLAMNVAIFAGAGHSRSEALPSVAASMPAATSGMIPRSR